MKLSKSYLKKLIKEELNNVLNEGQGEHMQNKKKVGRYIQTALNGLPQFPERAEIESDLSRTYAQETGSLAELAQYAYEQLNDWEFKAYDSMAYNKAMKALERIGSGDESYKLQNL